MNRAKTIFGVIAVLWAVTAFVSLYYFSYPSMDSWAYAAPAFYAPAPFHLVTPLLGTFEHSNEGWGLHWPGGPLLTSVPAWILPHHPAAYVAIYLFYWSLLVVAVVAVMLRLTGSWVAAGFAGCFIMGSRLCLNITWMQRYEMLAGAVTLAAALALTAPQRPHAWGRNMVIMVSFFFLPLLHPVYLGLTAGWLCLLLVFTLLLKKPWTDFALAATGYVGGIGTFAAYYALQPAQWIHFREHAANIAALGAQVVPGIALRFIRLLWLTDGPIRIGGALYIAAFIILFGLGWTLWRQRTAFRTMLAENELRIYVASGLAGAFILALQTYHIWYSSTAWPFAVVVVCTAVYGWAKTRSPQVRVLVLMAALAITTAHALALPYRTMKWAQSGFINLRAESESFIRSLPPGGQLYIPESLASTVAIRERTAYMNSLPYIAPSAAQDRYRGFLQSRMHSGDVFITDRFQQNPVHWLDQLRWREIRRKTIVWKSGGEERGLDLTAYEKR